VLISNASSSNAPGFTTVAVLFVIISESNHNGGPINLLQQTGTQVTMMVVRVLFVLCIINALFLVTKNSSHYPFEQ
jgi:hypothetical protein